MRITSLLLPVFAAAALIGGAAQASSANLVKNGNFDLTGAKGGNKQLSYGENNDAHRTTLIDWVSYNGNDGGYNFVLNSGTATTWDSSLWLNGNNNGFTASGNFFASDPMYYPGSLTQNISGLTVGNTYTLSFQYALAQQTGYKGGNADFWQVSFGGVTKNTDTLAIGQGGFSGWQTATMTFKATDTSEALSFLAKAATPGAPPFMLLDGVSLISAVPEPSTWGMLLGGMGLVGFAARRRAAMQA